MLRRSLPTAIAAATMVAVAAAGAPAAGAHPVLHWTSAPPPGGRVLLDTSAAPTLRLAAAAGNKRTRVRLSLLGKTPVRISGHAGNPAVGTLHFPVVRDFRLRTYVVTVVARTLGTHRLAISRTLVVSVRARTISLTGPGASSRWAYVLQRVPARARPSSSARSVGRLQTTTSDSRPNLVRALAQTRTQSGATWTKVALTSLPNGRTGWVPRGTLSVYHTVNTRIVVDTRHLVLTLLRNGRRVFRARIAVGTARWPTPRGTFYIRERLTNFHDAFYGPVAFGTSARSTKLTDWPGGGIVGIHGTNAPQQIPGRISHGCIRLRNPDILRLARLLPLGTPVEIR